MFFKILKSLFGSRNDRLLKRYSVFLKKINFLENSLKLLSDIELKNKFFLLKNNIKDDNDLPLVYAIVREVATRVLKMRHYDVQILGGIALYYGKIVEIATGEGKTLIATLPVCFYFLFNKPIHVVTVNDYLAKRDANWMMPIYLFLGLSVGVIIPGMSNADRKRSYKCDVVYGTSNEFAFDYLRDNIVTTADEKVQQVLYYSIIDEVDSILIDEARTPLIISLPDQIKPKPYVIIDKLVKHLLPYNQLNNNGDFIIDEKTKQIQFTDIGFSNLELLLKKYNLLTDISTLYDIKNIELLHDIYAVLKANYFFKKDVDYIVKDNSILIIDEHTGRILEGRRWSDGIHQAIESKEGVNVRSENQTLASITFQNYFRLYTILSGMTGTAYTESTEFRAIYGLEVVIIPTNKPNIRIDNPDLIFLTKNVKFNSIINDIKHCHTVGQPVLVGTVSIEISEYLSTLLRKLKIKHNVLNAKYHFKESEIISEAGKIFSVTIATNMAGRGTDIVLGGKFENETDEYFEKRLKVVKLGGLKIIGTERHESRRIDNQLRGRSGRQGDPGSSQFYLSLEDDLIRIFIGDKALSLLNKLNMSENEVISHSLISKAIENAQRRVENYNFDIRKQLLEFDDIINEQRLVIYEYRNSLIFNDNISIMIIDVLKDVSKFFVQNSVEFIDGFCSLDHLVRIFNLEFGLNLFNNEKYGDFEYTANIIFDTLLISYKSRKNESGEKNVCIFEKLLFLNILDIKWKEHLTNLDYLKKGIHLRGYAQKDPKLEYKSEAFALFKCMLNDIKYEFVVLFFKFSVDLITNKIESDIEIKSLNFDHDYINAYSSTSSEKEKNVPYIRKQPKMGRNELCYCGSKKKYKQCHSKYTI